MNTLPKLLENKFNSPSISGKSSFQQRRYLDICNISVFESKRLDDCEFTNFLPSYNSELTSILADLLEYLEDGYSGNNNSSLLSFALDDNINISYDLRNKIESITNLYFLEEINFNQIGKAKIISNFHKKSTSFRIYLNITSESHSIILLDPLHFVIPSRVQRQKEHSFQTHKGNNLCMYKHIISKNSEMQKRYNSILSVVGK